MNPSGRNIDFTDIGELNDEPQKGSVTEDKTDPGKGVPSPVKENPKFRIRELIDGTVLVRENMIRQLPFVLFLTLLGILYIGNRFHAEYMVRQINDLKTEVNNLRAEQITTASELMNISRPSQVAALVASKNMGLKESMEPPKKLKRR